ncbi:acyltransferase family protein [Microbacterium soli]|uniref:Acyltransferase family protein n=1 Tax=Microbacterium soli TaxID=446075 RepID=A0ABP7MQ46_9MICO
MASVATDREALPARIGARAARAVRGDIQALRAYAVAAVVLFHVWPRAVTGGYVGVDVFFVISGFLITGQLVRLRERGALLLSAFWAARARRLLPAALLVLIVSTGLTLLFAPASLVTQYLRSIIGSTAYVENWVLAADAIDYLAADNAPPIAQHYWSLSVEEQFYIIWPLVVIVGMLWGARRRLLGLIVALTAGSLVYSVVATFTDPSAAYFATPSRVWEFGLGAVVALLPTLAIPRVIRSVMWVLGWLALLLSAFVLNAATPFPGYAAILPVAAAAAVIAAGPEAPFAAARVQDLRPLQWVGDNSYGIYLWHWPLVVIAPAVLGRPPRLAENITLVCLTVVAAALSKRFVEDPLRFGALSRVRPRWILIGVAASMAVVITTAALPIQLLFASATTKTEQARTQLLDPTECRGASLLLEPGCAQQRAKGSVPAADLVPPLTGLYDDTGGAFSCYQSDSSIAIVPCHLGSDAADSVRIAVTGDSHAAMLTPAFRDIAEENNWAVDVYVGRGCVWADDPDPNCATRLVALNADLLSHHYDAIIVTAWNQLTLDDTQRTARAEQFVSVWRDAAAAGITVIPVLDNPGVPESSADCLNENSAFDAATCSFSAEQSLLPDPLGIASADLGIQPVDLRAAFCDTDGRCPMVAGGVVVYRDLHHITASFSHSLAPYLSEQIMSGIDHSTR